MLVYVLQMTFLWCVMLWAHCQPQSLTILFMSWLWFLGCPCPTWKIQKKNMVTESCVRLGSFGSWCFTQPANASWSKPWRTAMGQDKFSSRHKLLAGGWPRTSSFFPMSKSFWGALDACLQESYGKLIHDSWLDETNHFIGWFAERSRNNSVYIEPQVCHRWEGCQRWWFK